MTINEIETEIEAYVGERIDLTQPIAFDMVNSAYQQLAMSFRFYENEKTNTAIPTVANQANYTVPTGCRETISYRDTTSKFTLEPKDILWYESLDSSTDTSGPPEFYVRFGSEYFLWPTPDAVYATRIRYTALPAELTSGESPVYPAEWHRVIALLAASQACFRFGMDTKGMNLKSEALGLITALQEDPVMDARRRYGQIVVERLRPGRGRRGVGYAEYPF